MNAKVATLIALAAHLSNSVPTVTLSVDPPPAGHARGFPFAAHPRAEDPAASGPVLSLSLIKHRVHLLGSIHGPGILKLLFAHDKKATL
jgi:hypothetical protein